MKQNDLTDTKYTLAPQNYENIFNVYTDDDVGYFFNILRTVNFPDPDQLDTSVYDNYTIQPRDTWPLISWRSYGSILLWWSICATNHIDNPITPLIPGTVIKVIKQEYLQNILNDIQIL